MLLWYQVSFLLTTTGSKLYQISGLWVKYEYFISPQMKFYKYFSGQGYTIQLEGDEKIIAQGSQVVDC